jgi:hypothetical protein
MKDGSRFERRGSEIVNGVVQEDGPEPPPSDDPAVDFHTLPAVQFKALVQSYGELYTNKVAALAFLEGRSINSCRHWTTEQTGRLADGSKSPPSFFC